MKAYIENWTLFIQFRNEKTIKWLRNHTKWIAIDNPLKGKKKNKLQYDMIYCPFHLKKIINLFTYMC